MARLGGMRWLVQHLLTNTLSCLEARYIHKEKDDLLQLFACGGNLAEKCVVVRSQLVHVLQLYFPLFISHPDLNKMRGSLP